MADPVKATLRRFHWLLYGTTFLALTVFWPLVDFDSNAARLFILAATAAYAGLYILPVVLLNGLLGHVLKVGAGETAWRLWVRYGVALVAASLVLLAIYADYRLYGLYQFHFNAFVWNLLTTPGGVAAMGATAATERTIAFQVSLIVAGCGAILWLLQRWTLRTHRAPRSIAGFLAALMLVMAGTELTYGYSMHTGQEDLLAAADAIPFHLKTSTAGLMKALHVERTALKDLRLAGGEVDYPGKNLAAKVSAPMPNLIMLVAESFRWDLMTPEITPNLWRLSQRGQRFDNHYSGGNRTRMGLFSMFYGIYAPYWYSFERQRVAPALMNFLRDHDYQLALHTSQSFDYPELRNTLFTGVPEKFMQELKTGEPWQRDVQNISDLIAKLDAREPGKPFYDFMFFESTHAPYTFPEDKALRKEYAKELDYINLDLKNNIQGIHARYINAAHHIDEQVGRLLASLEQRQLMDKTVIMFTGDHGEEFMEKGHWGHGHGSSFHEEQIRVPLVLWMPGQAPKVTSYRTSHLQIPATLLSYLGVTAPSRSYSSADPLSVPTETLVFGEYDYMGLGDGSYKITFPYTGSSFFRYRMFDGNDTPLDRQAGAKVLADNKAALDAMINESSRFLKR